jgi:hypothetical protein
MIETAKDFKALSDELQEAYTPIISLEQWLYGETPCSKMVNDMLKEKVQP